MQDYSGAMMRPDPVQFRHAKLATCTWCGAPLGRNVMLKTLAAVFCSRPCEIEANAWLYLEMCEIEVTLPTGLAADEDESDTREDRSGNL
jgi:hypothetical protein